MAFLNFMTRQLLANRELCNLDARTFCNNLSALEIAQLEPRATVKCQIVAVLTSAGAAPSNAAPSVSTGTATAPLTPPPPLENIQMPSLFREYFLSCICFITQPTLNCATLTPGHFATT